MIDLEPYPNLNRMNSFIPEQVLCILTGHPHLSGTNHPHCEHPQVIALILRLLNKTLALRVIELIHDYNKRLHEHVLVRSISIQYVSTDAVKMLDEVMLDKIKNTSGVIMFSDDTALTFMDSIYTKTEPYASMFSIKVAEEMKYHEEEYGLSIYEQYRNS